MEKLTIQQLSEEKRTLVYQLFVGKVSEIIGFDKTLELLRESKKAITQEP